MNSLHRDIQNNEIVVLDKQYLKPEFHALDQRLFVCQGGFGMMQDTVGSAIFGMFLCDGEECRQEGYRINAKETIEYQQSHPVIYVG